MNIRALVVDIDGTITYRDRRLDCAAVSALRSLNIPVILSTGNVLCVAETTATLVGTGKIVIAENGGVIGYNGVDYLETNITECQKAFDILSRHMELVKLNPVERKTEIALRRDFNVQAAREILKDLDFKVDIIDTGFAVHIKDININKGTGLQRVSQITGIDVEDFAAIGDSPNDREMLEVSGFGIAVANAHPELKKVADLVTTKNHGEGVAEAIEYMRSMGWIH